MQKILVRLIKAEVLEKFCNDKWNINTICRFSLQISQIVDTFGFLFWFILNLCLVAAMAYYDYYELFYKSGEKFDKSTQITYLGLDLVCPFYAICCIIGKIF